MQTTKKPLDLMRENIDTYQEFFALHEDLQQALASLSVPEREELLEKNEEIRTVVNQLLEQSAAIAQEILDLVKNQEKS